MDFSTLFKPHVLNVALSFVFFSLLFHFLSPVFSTISLLPCLYEQSATWGWCSINPLGTQESTIYFGFMILDVLYQAFYLFAMCALAYAVAAVSMSSYTRRRS